MESDVNEAGWWKWFVLREARVQISALEDASQDKDVARWRKRFLKSAEPLGSWEAVHAWFWEHFDGIATTEEEREDGWPIVEERGSGLETHGEVLTAPPTNSKLFREGKRLSETLADRYGWTKQTAGGWLVGGFLPKPEPPVIIDKDHGYAHPWGAVRLVIPYEMPPSAVAELYAAERKRALSNIPLIEGKPIAEKTLRATVHAVRYRLQGSTWSDTYRAWQQLVKNGDIPKEWGFESLHGYMAAARKAYKRLTGRVLESKSAEK